jgi:glycosyltransferase involved in cell wall biosynthesis
MVTPRFFPHAGGVQTHVREVGERLIDAGIDVHVLTTDAEGDLPPRAMVGRLPVIRVPAWPKGRDYYLAPRIWETVRSGHWDLVHCQGVHTFVAPLAMVAARRARVPYVVTFHTGGHSAAVRARLRELQWLALRPLLSRACRLVAVSGYEADLFRRLLHLRRDQLLTIPNGIAPMAASDADLPAVTPNLIVSLGRLERYKGHHRLLEAMPHILGRVSSAKALLVGSGRYEPQLRAMIDRLGLQDSVSITSVPPQDRGSMARLLSSAALVVLLSDYEAHPVAVLEAASLGRPVLVRRTSGLTELVEAGTARGIDADAGAKGIASAIVDALDDPHPAALPRLPTCDKATDRLLGVYRRCMR